MKLLLALLISTTTAHAESSFETSVSKKSEQKRASRFTLTEWLAMKDRNRSMDMWLAANSHESPYEFFAEGRSIGYQSTTVNDPRSYGGSLGAYAGVAGIRGAFDSDSENRTTTQASVNLRLFGRALQDTHINLAYGLRAMTLKDSNDESFANQFGAVSTNLYLTKFFGLSGSYAHLFPASSNRDRTVSGEESKAGVFIDFKALRLFGEWKNEFLHYDQTTGGSSEFRQGLGGGIRFFF